MKRKLISLLLCLTVLFSLPVQVFAAYPPVMDSANLLTDEEYQSLQEQCLTFRETYGLDVAICTTDTLDGKSPQSYADDWYDDHQYSSDGLLFLISMEERDSYISTAGDAIAKLSDDDLEEIEYLVIPYLSDGLYYDGFSHFLSILPQFLEEGEPVDVYYDAQGNLHAVYEQEQPSVNLFLSVLIGAVTAGIVLLVMRGLMNTKSPKHSAADYLNQGSYRLTRNQDLFLYSNVSKVRRQEPSSSSRGGSTVHRSSSGRSHGGRGGKF